jgi:hypothetical protein
MLLVRISALAGAAALLLSGGVAAQSPDVRGTPATALGAVPLRSVYAVRLESAWPAPAGETDACNNRATETLVGTLRRVAPDRYEGRLERRTLLGFCGTHGAAVQPCGAVLRGEGEVAAEGRVVRDRGRARMSLIWQPVPGTTRTALEGSCAPRFTAALEAMYRTAVHAVDFELPPASPHRVVLEDYGRMLEIR